MKKEGEIAFYTSAVKFADEDHIFVKPVCEYFGIKYKHQATKFSEDLILKRESRKFSHVPTFGDHQRHLAVTKRGFIRWVQLTNSSICHPSVAEKFEQFQLLIFDILYSGSIIKDQYIQYVKKEMKELDELRKEYGRQGNEIKKKKYHIEKVMGMEFGEWKEMVEIAEPAQIEGGM